MLGDDILGQPAVLRMLDRALQQGRLAQSYLFEGPSGVGKRRTALALAAAAIADGVPDPALRERISSGKHPDVRLYGPREEGHGNLPVELLREEILPFTQYAPFESSQAFLVFDEAHICFPPHHAEAANALLKTLEEPRPRVHFILISERPDQLLPTIRSRCQRVRFQRLETAVLDAILAQQGIESAPRDAAIALADGQADRALELARDGRAQVLLDQALRLDAAIAEGAPGKLVELSESLARQDDLRAVLESLAMVYRDVAAHRAGLPDDLLLFRRAAERIRAHAERLDAEEAAARVRLLQHTVRSFDRNANVGLALDALLLHLGHARASMPKLDIAPFR
jgi:DNA polymerase III subunit delta'